MPKRPIDYLRVLSLFLLLTKQSSALILYSGDNSANQTAPDSDRTDIFNSIGRPCTSTGSGSYGSVIHIHGKYVLTANHVSVGGNYVTFDGSTLWARDTNFTPIQIGTADMKLIKLLEDPELAEVPLLTSTTADILATATLIGWGVGRDPEVSDSGSGQTNTWTWGNSSTFAKRWGNNRIDASIPANTAPYNFTYDALTTDLDNSTNEAAAAIYDSGSGLFVNDGGTWKLAGLTTAVSTSGSSTFARFGGSLNFFVRISSYAPDIEAAIPDLTTLSGWKIDHSLYGADADNTADTDFDGISQLHEFAFGGDPNVHDISILPTHALVEDGGSTYLELSVTRPIDIQGITYTPQTTTDLSNWPSDTTGIVNDNPSPVDNGDGTETLTYRRSQSTTATDKAFIRINISESL